MSHNITSDGSPTPRKTGPCLAPEDFRLEPSSEALGAAGAKRPTPSFQDASSRPAHRFQQGAERQSTLQAPKASFKPTFETGNGSPHMASTPMTELMARLTEQSAALNLQPKTMAKEHDNTVSTGSAPVDGTWTSTPPADADAYPAGGPMHVASNEMTRLKKELDDARGEIARMNQELHTSRITKSTLDQTMSQGSEADYFLKGDVTEQTISQLQSALNASTRPNIGRQAWLAQDDARSDGSESLSVKALAKGPALWGSGSRHAAPLAAPVAQPYAVGATSWINDFSRPYHGNMGAAANAKAFATPSHSRPSTGQSGYRGRNQFLNEPTHFPVEPAFRNGVLSNPPSRPGSAFEAPRYGCSGYPNAAAAGGTGPDAMAMGAAGMYAPAPSAMPFAPYGPRSMGTRLSPEAAEFNVDALAPTPWNAQVNRRAEVTRPLANARTQPVAESGITYVSPVEPMNYRRLLDRNVNCNWKYIVDKIICNNDQQASIFLQQKLKVGTAEQKFEIVEAIIAQALPLMVNRFGNFLVQRCFEHGTAEQVVAIAGAIRGNVLTLSMDAFGCHVIQKAFDAVPEEYKATMVHELLRRIPETVIHRYACHVWQKLFELRWSDSPPQIMRYVNEALRGMWHEVALGETGSLVVQNIFENCLEEDKRPCINEVLASIDVISRGQYGNWCIQHICEHGAPADRSRAVDHILRLATDYSMDQYASKVIEKCLKIGGNEFLDRFLERVCEGRPDRPRMPLIDIAGDQFGNYLVQYILTNSSPHHRELVASHVRKHMVSLRGSKYGSRVAMLCCNHAIATRPGPPMGMQMNRYGSTHRGGPYGSFR